MAFAGEFAVSGVYLEVEGSNPPFLRRTSNTLRGLRVPAVGNLLSAVVLKGGGMFYSILIVGVAARSLGPVQTSLLIEAFSILVPLGLVQAGVGTLVLRSVSHAHAQGRSLATLKDVRNAFWIVLSLSLCVLPVVVLLLWRNHFSFLIPVAILQLAGFVCSISDQVRTGLEKGWSSNAFLFFSYILLSVLFTALRMNHSVTLISASLISYGAAGISSILSFACMMFIKDFRRLLASAKTDGYWNVVRPAVPILLISAASALLLNIPTTGSAFPWFPTMRAADAALFRLCITIANASSFVAMAIFPTLIRHRYTYSAERYQKSVLVSISGLCLVVVCTCLIFSNYSSRFIQAWINVNNVDPSLARKWSLVLGLWITAGVIGQYVVLSGRATRIFVVVVCTDLAIVTAPLLEPLNIKVDLASAMACGMAVYFFGSIYFAVSDFRQTILEKRHLSGG